MSNIYVCYKRERSERVKFFNANTLYQIVIVVHKYYSGFLVDALGFIWTEFLNNFFRDRLVSFPDSLVLDIS